MGAEKPTDKELLKQLAAGIPLALEELMRRYEPVVYGFALRILKSSELAEEVSQDIFLKIWERRTEFVDIESLPAWLFSMAKNQSINTLKEIARRYVHEEKYASALTEQLDGEGEVHFNDLKQFANKLVDQLSPQRKIIYLMKMQQGLSTEEIAQQLKLSSSTVRTQLAKSYQILRSMLSEHLYVLLIALLLS